MFKKFIIFIIAVTVAGYLIFRLTEKTIGENQVKIGAATFFVEIADSQDEYAKGLSGRPALRDNRGMLFVFKKSDLYPFWMKDMLFPIDIIWINGGRVIGFEEYLPPDGGAALKVYYPPSLVDRVLEVKAGTAAKYQIKPGDAVEIIGLAG